MSDSLKIKQAVTLAKKTPLIVVPVYNHAATLTQVLHDLSLLEYPLLVVNDGSSDAIENVLTKFPTIDVLHHERNLGKGAAIASAMRFAETRGHQAILTFDADGQHLARDVPQLVAAHFETPEALIIGARDFQSPESGDIPGSSKFGRSFSNFWIWTETGRWLSDTQTGLRIYPVDLNWLSSISGYRYSFEVEAITRMIWQGRPTRSIPVSTYYPDRSKRISHFHAFWDNFWITKTHTRLVILHLCKLLGLYRPVKFKSQKRPELRGIGLAGQIIKRFGSRFAYGLMIFPVLTSYLSRSYERRALTTFYRKVRPHWTALQRQLGVLRNYAQFAASIIDRTNPEGFMLVESKVAKVGASAMQKAFPKGAILLGAHYGDWALIAGRIKPFLSGSLGLVADPAVTPRFFQELEQRLKGKLRVINSRQDALGFALSVKEVLDDDGNVAFLADRRPMDEGESLSCSFFGEEALWPKAPFALAARLQVPVVFVTATKDGLSPSAAYQVEYEELWKGDRRIKDHELLKLYVRALESKVNARPEHWFNFFPFW
ncbi:MAG: glycosyltransferase family 2 protein [Proteobacteria bacterium]|nr:MAG: glycosyltransferase family 2 protein [Pseudomonadota bacterium]